ncbi:MAG: gliding motility-associated C-terminal domain-containing protein [Salibacteraceae bacterium]
MRIFYKSLIVLTLLFIGFTQDSKASHISGGDISYECIGQDSFLITLNLFRDCDGVGLGTTQNVNFTSTCGGTANAQLVQTVSNEISQLCPNQIPNSTCNGGNWPGMEQYVYTGIVVLSPPCNSWTMSWSSCCRNQQISNLTAPQGLNTYLYTTMYSGVDSCNTSPTFTSLPIPYVCMNQVVNYNFGVVEPDGDSIVYFMSPGFENATNLVPYATPYTFNQPLPGANAVLNAFNGQLTFTPTQTGVYVIVVRIEEYDRATGVIKGTSIRDIQVVVQNCSNDQPSIDSPGIYNFSGSGTQVDSNTIDVCIGDSFSFDISFSDPDTQQTLSLFHNIYTALDSTAQITITGTNPAVMNIKWIAQPGSPPFTSFMVTAIDDACPVVGLVSAVFNVNIFPSTYAGPDESICEGTQWKQLNVTGGNQFTWFVISGSPIDTIPTSPNFNMTCWHCDNPSVSPQITTTYGVISNLVSNCKSIDTVTVTVNPNFNLVMPNDTLICPIDSIMLPVQTSEPTFTYTYQWSPSQYMNFDTISNPTVLPLAPTNFRVTMTANGGCEKQGSVFVNLAPAFPPNVEIFGDTVICIGDSADLEVVLGEVPSPFCGLSTSPCVGNNLSGIIGNGNLTNVQWDGYAPYKGNSKSSRNQYLFLASELYAMGMTSGKINGVSFENLLIGTVTSFENFQVKMGCTSVTDLTGGFETGLHTVLPAYTHNATTGWNTHSFATDYDWDGVSNIVVEICFANPSSVFNGTVSTKYTDFGFACTRSSNNTVNDVCTISTFSNTSTRRPNIKFDFCTGANPNGFTYAWSPNYNIDSLNNNSATVYPATATTYSVVVQDSFGSCSDTVQHFINVVNQFDAGFSLIDTACINGGLQIASPNVGGGVFSGTGIVDSINGVFDPTVSGIGPFSINYEVSSLNGGCLSDSNGTITVIGLPDATFTAKDFCVGSSPDTLVPNIPGGKWTGSAITDTTYGIFDPQGKPAGSYQVIYTLNDPCFNADTQMIKIVEPFTFTWTSPLVNVCEGSTIDLNNNYNLSSNPLQGSGPVISIWSDANGYVDTSGVFDATNVALGDYVVTLAIMGPDSTCGQTQTMTVRVRPIEYTSPSGDLAFCSDDNQARIFISPWLFGAGVTFTQTPIAPLAATDTLNIHPYGQNGEFDATIHGIGEWEFEVTLVNQYGCVGVTTDTIYVLDTPAKPILDEAVYCEGDEIWLSATGVNEDSIYWYSTFLLDDTIGIGNPQYYNTAPDPSTIPNGMYVWVTENNWACVSPKQEYRLPIYPSPVADYNITYEDTNEVMKIDEPHYNSPIYGFTPFLVNFNAINANPTDTIKWFHNWENYPDVNAMNPNYTNSPSVSFKYETPNLDKDGQLIDGAQVYINQLIITNEWGCADTSSTEIYSIASEQFYNVFTPNGDGKNEIFYVPVFGLEDYKVQIFNRWGKLVYEWEDPSTGWAGEDQPDGVYFYVVTGIKPDADRTEYKQQGTVTLTGSGK